MVREKHHPNNFNLQPEISAVTETLAEELEFAQTALDGKEAEIEKLARDNNELKIANQTLKRNQEKPTVRGRTASRRHLVR